MVIMAFGMMKMAIFLAVRSISANLMKKLVKKIKCCQIMIKKERYKKYLIDGNYYTIRQLSLKVGKHSATIKKKIFDDGATTFKELKAKIKVRKSVNFHRSMYADRHGHWRLLARALGC